MATHTNDLGNKIWVGQMPLGTSKDRARSKSKVVAFVRNSFGKSSPGSAPPGSG